MEYTLSRVAWERLIGELDSDIEAMQQEYLKLETGIERTQYLINKFGRSGIEMQPIFEDGNAAKATKLLRAAIIDTTKY